MPEPLRVTLESHFCVVFAGNLGSVQGVPALVETARRLPAACGVRVVLIGTGSMVEWVASSVDADPAPALVVWPRLPPSAMPEVFARAGALLVSLNDDPSLGQTVPSKLQSYLAAGRPIIAAMPGEGARLVREAGAGVVTPPGDVGALVAAIVGLAGATAQERQRMGEAGRTYFLEHFEMRRQAARLVQVLSERMGAAS